MNLSGRRLVYAFLILIIIALVYLTVSGRSQQQVPPPVTTAEQETTTSPQLAAQPEVASYSLEEVAKHNSETDCWLVIDGKVFAVTEFIPAHPGEKAILAGCGKDATTLFETRPMGSGTPHSNRARELRQNYYIGDLEQ